jgi:hypothetical protein
MLRLRADLAPPSLSSASSPFASAFASAAPWLLPAAVALAARRRGVEVGYDSGRSRWYSRISSQISACYCRYSFKSVSVTRVKAF